MDNPLNQSVHSVVEDDLIADIEPVISSVSGILEALGCDQEINKKMMGLTRHSEVVVLATMLYGLLKTHLETERRFNAPDIPRGEKAVILHRYPESVKRLITEWELDHKTHTKEEWFYALLAINWMVSRGQAGGENSNG